MNKLEPCPFCGGKAKISFRQGRFFGMNDFGNKKMQYHIQVICNRCKARGRLFTTDWMIDPNPWNRPEEFRQYINKAEIDWNMTAMNCS